MDNSAIESIVQAVLKKLSESGESADVKKSDIVSEIGRASCRERV